MQNRSLTTVLWSGSRNLAFAGCLLAMLAAIPEPGAAQRQNPTVETVNFEIRDDGTPVQLRTRRGGFNLFAEEDLAGSALRLSGQFRYLHINAGGLCPFANAGGDFFNTACGGVIGASTYFSNNSVWGVGIDDYRKIREVYPDIAKMLPTVGYGTPWRVTSAAPFSLRIGPADGQFGRYFSGATSDNAGNDCRAFVGNPGAGMPDNFTLTAASDCPDTWAPTGFDGIRQVSDAQWLERFQANPAAFTWDSHKFVPAADAPVLGDLTTYGAFSDYNRETLALYGEVTPKGSGPSRERGFPLGLYVHVDVFKFDRPSVRDGVYIRWLVINRSEDVYGRGVDYEKIYMGLMPSYTFGGQAPNIHNDVRYGVNLAGGSQLSGLCSSTFPRRMPPGNTEGCDGANRPPRYIMWLKTPLGDLKNKLFSDPNSAYYFPNHPNADDTITFNHYRRGGFGAQEQWSWRRSDRALFGLLSGDEELWLDGRPYTDFSAQSIWRYFRYEFTDGTQSRENLRWNRSVPGSIPGYGKWDYNDDGIQDTLYLPDCGSQGCARLWGDSIAGGFSSDMGSNSWTFTGFGPFALKAGDTTEILIYTGSANANDTLRVNAHLKNVIQTYYKNFSGASQYPTPVISASDVQLDPAWFRDSTAGSQNTTVRIQVRMPPREDDSFLKSVLELLESDDPRAVNLRNLNPDLIDVVRGRMRQNLAEVLVFKSCDGGTSWSSGSDCTSATAAFQTRDDAGAPVGIGWRWRFRLAADSITGDLSSNVVSENVQAGREYLYSFVTKTRSLQDVFVITEQTVNAAGQILSQTTATLEDVFNIDIDTLVSGLKSSGPSTARVYAPLSVPAGTIYARLDTLRIQAPDVTNRVTTTIRRTDIAGVFRMRFGNRFVITRTEDTVTGARTSRVIRQSVYTRGATSPTGPVTLDAVAAADTFSSNAEFTFSGPSNNRLSTTPKSVSGVVKTYVDTIRAAGYVVGEGSGGSQPFYVAVSAPNNFTFRQMTQTTTAFEGSTAYPGFNVTVTSETAPPAARLNRVVRDPSTADTLNNGVTNSNGIIYQTSSSASTNFGPGGFYKLRWQADAHGIENGVFYRYDQASVLQPQLDGALAGRAVASTTLIDESLRSLEDFPFGGATGTRPMIAAKLPFQIFGVSGEPANAVMFQRHTSGNETDSLFRNSRLWGNAGDTVRVQIPPDLWMPGDTLWVIENIVTDSTVTVGGNVVHILRDTTVNGRTQQLPIQVSRQIVGLKMTISCASGGSPTRITCNPFALGTRGATGYLPYDAGYESVWHLNRTFDQNSEIQLTAQALVPSGLPITKRDMNTITVVPNPYIVQSAFDRLATNRSVLESRIMFVNVPSEGMLRIYTISGQLVQQLTWTQADLVVSANGSAHGDLPYNLRTREGLDLGPGLYIWVLTARGEMSNGQMARGKFVLIR